MMQANADLSVTPSARPLRHQIASNFAVEMKEKFRSHRLVRERGGSDGVLDTQNPFGQQRSELGVA
jgi:hypothetical protein